MRPSGSRSKPKPAFFNDLEGGGQGWIRTSVRLHGQIYSLLGPHRIPRVLPAMSHPRCIERLGELAFDRTKVGERGPPFGYSHEYAMQFDRVNPVHDGHVGELPEQQIDPLLI